MIHDITTELPTACDTRRIGSNNSFFNPVHAARGRRRCIMQATPSGIHDFTSIRVQDLPGIKAGILRGQKHVGSGKLVGLPRPAHQVITAKLIHLIFIE